jgi:hypothetical protein
MSSCTSRIGCNDDAATISRKWATKSLTKTFPFAIIRSNFSTGNQNAPPAQVGAARLGRLLAR